MTALAAYLWGVFSLDDALARRVARWNRERSGAVALTVQPSFQWPEKKISRLAGKDRRGAGGDKS